MFLTALFEFGTSSIDAIIGYTGDVVQSVMPVLLIIIGVGIGLWILDHFLRH